jgi:hypothetical protein
MRDVRNGRHDAAARRQRRFRRFEQRDGVGEMLKNIREHDDIEPTQLLNQSRRQDVASDLQSALARPSSALFVRLHPDDPRLSIRDEVQRYGARPATDIEDASPLGNHVREHANDFVRLVWLPVVS